VTIKLLVLSGAIAFFMISCGSVEVSDLNIPTSADTEEETIDEPIEAPIEETVASAADLASGEWVSDVEATAASWEVEKNVTISDDDKANMAEMFKNIALSLNADGSFELKGMIIPKINGTGTWTMNETGDVLTATKDGEDPLDFDVTLLTESKLQLKQVKLDGGHTSIINLELMK
jgi:hypothetical protein